MATSAKQIEAQSEYRRPQSLAELRTEADRLFTEEALQERRETAPKGYLASTGKYTAEQLKAAHVAMGFSPRMKGLR